MGPRDWTYFLLICLLRKSFAVMVVFFTCVSASSVSLSWSHSRKAAAPYDSLPGGGLTLSLFLFVWLSLASLLWCVPLGAWLEFVVGFCLLFFFLCPSQRRVCVFTPGVGMKSGNLLVL